MSWELVQYNATNTMHVHVYVPVCNAHLSLCQRSWWHMDCRLEVHDCALDTSVTMRRWGTSRIIKWNTSVYISVRRALLQKKVFRLNGSRVLGVPTELWAHLNSAVRYSTALWHHQMQAVCVRTRGVIHVCLWVHVQFNSHPCTRK